LAVRTGRAGAGSQVHLGAGGDRNDTSVCYVRITIPPRMTELERIMSSLSKDVFVLRTGLTGYSTDWYRTAFPESMAFPEGAALLALSRLVRDETGHDLFEQIKPGDRVVIKPNLVRDWHPDGRDLYSVITHPAIIRAVVD